MVIVKPVNCLKSPLSLSVLAYNHFFQKTNFRIYRQQQDLDLTSFSPKPSFLLTPEKLVRFNRWGCQKLSGLNAPFMTQDPTHTTKAYSF